MPASYEFQILGPVGLGRDGEALPLGPPKRKAMVTALLLEANRPVPLPRLAAAVWPEPAPRSAVANLHSHVSALRQLLGRRLVTHQRGYELGVEDGELDANQFARLARGGREALSGGEPASALVRLGQALALWHGTAGTGLPHGTSLEARLLTLNEQRLDVFEDHVQARLCTCEFPQIAADLRVHLAAWPVRERGWELLMLALYRSGNLSGALAAYERAAATLAAELGIEPGRRLRKLHRAMLRRDPALDPTPPRELVTLARPPPATAVPAADAPPPGRAVPRQLPPDGTEPVGREAERAALAAALRGGPAAVVVTGPPGVGKSTLAVQAAHAVAAAEFPDGQVVVTLDGDGDGTAAPPGPSKVLAAALRALAGGAAQPEPGTVDELAAAYRTVAGRRRALVLLDGVADAAQVRPLLVGAGATTLLVTSRRRRLALPGPVRHQAVAPLAIREAATVLTRYAGAGRAGDEPAAIRQLARVCEGRPLALRIAGEWLARRPEVPARLFATYLAQEPLYGLCLEDLSVRAALAADLATVTTEDPLAGRVFRLLGGTSAATTPEELAGPVGANPSRVFFALERLVDQWLVGSPKPGQYRVVGLAGAYAAELAHAGDD